MNRLLACIAVLAVIATPVGAATPSPAPEAFLAEDSVAYFRFDGLEAHRAAFERTAWAECVRGDAGTFLEHLGHIALSPLGIGLVKDRLLQGITPDKLYLHQEAAAQLPRLLEHLRRHGVVVGVETRVLPPHLQVVLVFPNAGRDPRDHDAVAAGVRLLASLHDLSLRESKQDDSTLLEMPPGNGPVSLACRREGDHVVCTVAVGLVMAPPAPARRDGPNLTQCKLYREVAAFQQYETLARGFVDVERIAPLLRLIPTAGPLINELGLFALQALTLQWGCDGKAQRSSIALHLRGERKGLVRLLTAARGVELSQLPPLPPDVSNVVALHLDGGLMHDVLLQADEAIVRAVNPGELAAFKQNVAGVNKTLGIDLRKDLLAELGPTAVFYNSPGEGPVLFGPSLAIQVKDAAKVSRSLQTLERFLPAVFGGEAAVRKRDYRGTTIYSLHKTPFDPAFVPSLALHKGWLVVGLYPQSVQGFLLRSSAPYACWKPAGPTTLACAEAVRRPQSRVLAVSEMDPRAGLKRMCQLGPFVLGQIGRRQTGSLDLGLIPNFQAVNEPLFPNATLLIDDGDAVRLESRASIFLFLDLAGAESFLILGLISAL